MFSKTDATYKPQGGSYRKYVYAAIGATAAMLGGAALFGQVQDEQSFHEEAAGHFVNFLSDHRDYMVSTHNTIVDLLEEGYERQQDTFNAVEALTELNKSNKVNMKGKTVPAMKNGSNQLKENVKFAEKTTKGTVKPEDLTKNFADSAQFAAEIAKMFPKEYGIVAKLRQDLIVHHFDLANAIKDVALMAQTTKDNISRSVRKLKLRKKYEIAGKLKPTFDAKIWKYEIKCQNNDLQVQLEKCNDIVKVLEKMQKDCARTADDLNNVLLSIKEQLKKKIEHSKTKIADLEAQARAAKCNFWQMIFTFGAACRKAADLRNKLNSQIGSLRAEMNAAAKLDKRFHYFDSLKKLAATLTQEASGLLDVTKEFRSKLQSTQTELTQDFTDEEIDDQLGDEDFVNDFAEQLYDALERLDKQCDIVIADCKTRKTRLTNALIWNKLGEEDLMELAGTSGEAKLMSQFYDKMATGCNKYFTDASDKYASDAHDMASTIKNVGKHKHIIMNYARDEFHSVKGSLFNIVNSFEDSQRAIHSVDTYFLSRVKYFEKNISKPEWKYQLKYSTMITKMCDREHSRIGAFAKVIADNNKAISAKMGAIHTQFTQGVKKDLKAWDCDTMYPKPQRMDVGKPKWLGAATDFAKKGFAIYNKVKNFIPGGSIAGAGKVPGSHEEEVEELMNIDWGDVEEKVVGTGKKILDKIDNIFKEDKDSYAARVQIWQEVVQMCEQDKTNFKMEAQTTLQTISNMETPVALTAVAPKFTLSNALGKYLTDYSALGRDGMLTADEIEQNKSDLAEWTKSLKSMGKEIIHNEKYSEALKAALIK